MTHGELPRTPDKQPLQASQLEPIGIVLTGKAWEPGGPDRQHSLSGGLM